jgi:hypothetical protein
VGVSFAVERRFNDDGFGASIETLNTLLLCTRASINAATSTFPKRKSGEFVTVILHTKLKLFAAHSIGIKNWFVVNQHGQAAWLTIDHIGLRTSKFSIKKRSPSQR